MNLQNLVDFCEGAGLPSPFAGATVPDPLNIDHCISAIMVRCGLMTPLYNDPETFRGATAVWFNNKQWTFEHLIKLIQKDYDPLENYDRTDNFDHTKGTSATHSGGYEDKESGKDTTSLSGTDTEAHSGIDTTALSGTDTEAHSGKDTTKLSGTDTEAHSGTDTTTNEISAFNSSGYQADNKSSTTHGESIGTTYGKQEDLTHGESIGTTYGKSESLTHGESIGTTYGKQSDLTYGHTLTRTYNADKTTYSGKDNDSGRSHGNIGVTTTQQMFEQELQLLAHFDVYNWIAEQFENDNMILLY